MDSNWTLHHVGIPVRDLDKAIAAFESLGVSEFQPEFQIDSSKAAEYLVYGQTPDPVVKTRGTMGRMGPLGVELLQPVQGETVHKELLEASGEGVGHIAYTVEDLEAETAKLVAKGFQVILSVTPAGATERSAVYVDTRGVLGNLIIELMQAR